MQINLLASWIGMLLGFLSGLALGLFFHREDWLGGYGSFKRRLYRLAHISLFGLGAVNLAFYFTAHTLATGPSNENTGDVVQASSPAGSRSVPLRVSSGGETPPKPAAGTAALHRDWFAAGSLLRLASSAFVIGAIAMPICCLIMAHFPRARMLFAVPVISLVAGGALTLMEVIKL
jgi:hypothetical protein